MNSDPMTLKQKRIYFFIAGFCRQNGHSPSYREIMNAMGYTNTNSVTQHLKALQKKGMITSKPGIARTVRVIEQEETTP